MNGVGSFVICPVTAPSVLKMATCESTVSVAFVDESESCPSCQREVVSDSLELSSFSFLASKSSRSLVRRVWLLGNCYSGVLTKISRDHKSPLNSSHDFFDSSDG